MTINGKTTTLTSDDERARGSAHSPVLLAALLAAGNGVFPTGLLLTRAANGDLNPLEVVAGEVLATGDGATTAFAAVLAAGLPVEPGTVSVSDGVETFADDGFGRLTGDAGGSGTVNYGTGAVSVTFNANVGDGTDIVVGYTTAVNGVLDVAVDTDEDGSGVYIRHGSVIASTLKVGAVEKAAPSVALLALMADRGIFAE
ncbi:MAG: hypothetical protein C0621_07420 [Desulfuromonas sp.]|nr:MAG: hypothetical protein C0621_07420 [Desulfuromonas sp.]